MNQQQNQQGGDLWGLYWASLSAYCGDVEDEWFNGGSILSLLNLLFLHFPRGIEDNHKIIKLEAQIRGQGLV
jgi:hypothetical protein